jgi:hypothetical protein
MSVALILFLTPNEGKTFVYVDTPQKKRVIFEMFVLQQINFSKVQWRQQQLQYATYFIM